MRNMGSGSERGKRWGAVWRGAWRDVVLRTLCLGRTRDGVHLCRYGYLRIDYF